MIQEPENTANEQAAESATAAPVAEPTQSKSLSRFADLAKLGRIARKRLGFMSADPLQASSPLVVEKSDVVVKSSVEDEQNNSVAP